MSSESFSVMSEFSERLNNIGRFCLGDLCAESESRLQWSGASRPLNYQVILHDTLEVLTLELGWYNLTDSSQPPAP